MSPLSVEHFVAQNRAQWRALEEALGALEANAVSLAQVRQLDRLYRKATSDLARAQARYPSTDAQRYLNGLCTRAYAQLYRPRGASGSVLLGFWQRDFPRALRAEGRFVAVSAALFFFGVALGGILLAASPESSSWLVPQGVKDAVVERKMWTDSLIGSAPASFHAASIAKNNLSVTFATFAGGVLFGLGSIALLVFNGVHLGSVAVYCAQHGMGGALFDFVVGHGPVELSVIIIAGGAGLMVGQALVDPGELPRILALQKRGRDGIRLVLGGSPFLAAIACVEGFVSPGKIFALHSKTVLGMALGLAFWTYLLRAGRRGTTDEQTLGTQPVELERG